MGDGDRQPPGPDDCNFTLTDATIDQLSGKSVAKQVEVFSTVSNETRYRILLFLVEAENPICGCELEPYFEVGQSTISQSLTQLHRAGLVTRTKEGRWRYYEPTPTAEQLVDLIETNLTGEVMRAD